jgi:hypothetical protein
MALLAKQARDVGASENPAFRLSLMEIQVFRNEIQVGWNKSQIRRNEIQIKRLRFPSPNLAFSMTYADPRTFFAPPPALKDAASGGRVSFPFGRKADDRESISRIRFWSDSGFPVRPAVRRE